MYTSDETFHEFYCTFATRYKAPYIQIQFLLILSTEFYWFQRSKSPDKHTPITGKSTPIGVVVWKQRGKIVVHAYQRPDSCTLPTELLPLREICALS